jgi:phage terminase large subunit-like protein
VAAKRSGSADPVTAWARDVRADKMPANQLQHQAAERHLRDLDTAKTRGLVWRPDLAEAAIAFFKLLRHSKGVLAGQRFELQAWQAFIVGSLFGWVKKDGRRRFREAYVELPRKQGKTTLAAGVALLMAFFDREAGSEAFCAATKKDQARLAWDAARAMVLQSPELKRRLEVFAGAITGKDGSKLVPLGADEDTLDGLNVHCAIIDEVHAHRSSGVVDVLKTATGARTQPLIFYITTAGSGRESVCRRLRDYTTRVLEGVVPDDSFFGFIACADPGDDWRDPETWAKANPNLGVSVSLEQLRADAKQAERVPAWQARFRRLHLCEWLEAAEDRALDMR